MMFNFNFAVNFILLTLFSYNAEVYGFLWDVSRCSNFNPLIDGKTIILTANGNWREDKFCTAIKNY